jgi:ABC-type amino acid transport system permease subunit
MVGLLYFILIYLLSTVFRKIEVKLNVWFR